MEHLPAKLARQATIGAAPQEAWEVADAVEEEEARRRVPPTNQPTAPLRDRASNLRWRKGASDVSIYLQTGPDEVEGWSLDPVRGNDAQNAAMGRLLAFEQHELSKVEREDYFFLNPARGDATWINKQRLEDITLAVEAAHKHAQRYPPSDTKADVQLRVMSKLFAVVHLRALDAISARAEGSDRFVNICESVDLASLVENVRHMLVYRTEVKRAKSSASAVSPIATGIRRQYGHNTQLNHELGERGYPDGHRVDAPGAHAHFNPPMLPMFCSAPPRMGKSAVALLLSSLAVKLGGRVFYGVAPNKVVPVNEMLHKVRSALQWTPKPPPLTNYTKRPRLAVAASAARTTGQGLQVNDHDRPMHDNLHIVFYSHHVPTTELKAVIARIDALSKTQGEWVLHVRDEAQFLVKDSSYYYKEGSKVKAIPEYQPGWKRPPELLEQLRGTYPLKCGLSLCVSATLLPVLTETQLVGRVPHEFWGYLDADEWNEELEDARDERDHEAARLAIDDANAPRMVAVLSPQRGNLHVSDETPYWIKEHYPTLIRRGIYEVPRSYHGTMEHVEPWKAEDEEDVTYMNDGMWRLDEDSVADNYPELKQQLALVQAKGDESVPGMPRVYSPVVYAPSDDALAVLSHAREWLEQGEEDNSVQFRSSSEAGAHRFVPMYLLSPTRTQRGDGGTADWVQQIFKLAWLRMHGWFTGDDDSLPPSHDVVGSLPQQLNKRNLREHYGMIALVYASDENDIERRRYSRSLPSGGDGKEGELLVYCFDPVDPENRLAGHDFERFRKRAEARFAPFSGTEPSSWGPMVDKLEAGRMRTTATSLYVKKNRREGLNKKMVEVRKAKPADLTAELQRLLQEKLKRIHLSFDPDLAADEDMSRLLVNLNGIVLKLTTTRHENAQSAISYYTREYGIRKVLVSGYSMLSAGLTLQYTEYLQGSFGYWTHWVPKYFAVATVRKQLSLSESYQLVGRSFIDVRGGAQLPPGWKVQLLAAQYVIPVLTLYSRLELRFAMLRDMPLAQVFAHLSQFCVHPAIALNFDFPANLLAQFCRSQLSRQERKDGLVWELLRFTKPPSEDEEIRFTVPREGLVVGVD